MFESHRKESSIILQGGFIRAYNILLSYVSPTLLMFIVFSSLTGTGGSLTPRRVFTTLSLTLILRRSTLRFFARSVFFISEANVAFTRIQVRQVGESWPECGGWVWVCLGGWLCVCVCVCVCGQSHTDDLLLHAYGPARR